MSTTEPHPALNHRCPFCGAEPRRPCRTHRGRGGELDWPHSRRLAIVNDWMRQGERTAEQALCCECGHARTFKQARNYVAERSDLQTWHRMTGDLKCDACGCTTRHALLRSGEHRDAAEDYQRMALGGQPTDRLEDVDRARREYRRGLPRNPRLHHWYWVREAQAAWDGGERTVAALCGDTMTLHRDPRTTRGGKNVPMTHLVEPGEVRDMDYEDPETGMWWVDMDCVNCLRIANESRRKWRREHLQYLLGWFSLHPNKLSDEDGGDLLDQLERLAAPYYSTK